MPVTMDDIARLSGVSKATVSYILNNKQTSVGISQTTIDRVRKTVRELNYSPNRTAVRLGKQNKRKIEILVLSPWLDRSDSWFMSEVFRALRDAKKETKCQYRMYIPGELKLVFKEEDIPRYDSILVMGTDMKDDNFLESLHESTESIILLNRKLKNCIYVASNDYRGGELIAREALKPGYYDTYVILTSRNSSQVIEERKRGLIDYFQKRRRKKPHILMIKDEDKYPLTEQLQLALEKYGKNRVLFFTFLDSSAVKLMNFLMKRGIAIPQRAGITGYDCEPISALMIPAITTVNTKIYEMAATALATILRKHEGKAITSKILTPEIVSGESIVRPKHSQKELKWEKMQAVKTAAVLPS